jgi:uncharacterized protein YbdZ (MbtH family)
MICSPHSLGKPYTAGHSRREVRLKILVDDNDKEQYSLQPADLPVPGGWAETGYARETPEVSL